MSKVNFISSLKKLTFGGLDEYNLESIDLRQKQILDNFSSYIYYYTENP